MRFCSKEFWFAAVVLDTKSLSIIYAIIENIMPHSKVNPAAVPSIEHTFTLSVPKKAAVINVAERNLNQDSL